MPIDKKKKTSKTVRTPEKPICTDTSPLSVIKAALEEALRQVPEQVQIDIKFL